jgi:hypothetical protein
LDDQRPVALNTVRPGLAGFIVPVDRRGRAEINQAGSESRLCPRKSLSGELGDLALSHSSGAGCKYKQYTRQALTTSFGRARIVGVQTCSPKKLATTITTTTTPMM